MIANFWYILASMLDGVGATLILLHYWELIAAQPLAVSVLLILRFFLE